MLPRIVSRVARSRPTSPQVSPTLSAIRANFRSTSKADDAEIVAETDVPYMSDLNGERPSEAQYASQGTIMRPVGIDTRRPAIPLSPSLPPFVNPSSANGPVTPAGGDVEKPAVPLNPNLLPQLTPTLQRFTLPGKVAVVTG